MPAGPPEAIRVRNAPAPTGTVADATKVVTEVTRQKYIARVIRVIDIAGAAGVGLFAAALAYSTMFALIPLVLLMAGVLGWLIEDPTQRQELLAQLIGYFPPLAEFFSAALNGVVSARGVLSVVGIVGLLWGSSNFYAGLDEVMRRIFPGGNVRGPIDRRLRGIITVVGLMGLLVVTVLLSSVWAIVNQLVGDLVVWSYIVPIIGLADFYRRRADHLPAGAHRATEFPRRTATGAPRRHRNWPVDQPVWRAGTVVDRQPGGVRCDCDGIRRPDLAELQLPDAALLRGMGQVAARSRE